MTELKFRKMLQNVVFLTLHPHKMPKRRLLKHVKKCKVENARILYVKNSLNKYLVV